jgi:hypothetical protein
VLIAVEELLVSGLFPSLPIPAALSDSSIV